MGSAEAQEAQAVEGWKRTTHDDACTQCLRIEMTQPRRTRHRTDRQTARRTKDVPQNTKKNTIGKEKKYSPRAPPRIRVHLAQVREIRARATAAARALAVCHRCDRAQRPPSRPHLRPSIPAEAS